MADCSTESDTASDALVEQRGHTPIVTMNSLAERNTFTIEMLPAMVEAWDEGSAIPTSDAASSPAPRLTKSLIAAVDVLMAQTRTTRTHIDTQIAIEVILSANAQEEPRAFAEKRPPRFQSK